MLVGLLLMLVANVTSGERCEGDWASKRETPLKEMPCLAVKTIASESRPWWLTSSTSSTNSTSRKNNLEASDVTRERFRPQGKDFSGDIQKHDRNTLSRSLCSNLKLRGMTDITWCQKHQPAFVALEVQQRPSCQRLQCLWQGPCW